MDHIKYIDRKSGKLCKETVPGEQWLKWLYHNPLGKLALHGLIKRKFISQWYGSKMDCPASKNKIPDFVKDLGIDMNEATRPVKDYNSFNDFFIRQLKPECRPVDPAAETIVSPADGKILAFAKISGLDSFFVKGQTFDLDNFFQNSMLSKKYDGGTLLIIRLAPVDYHRFHFPADGIISASSPINGDYFSVSPYAVKNMLNIYWENKREYSILKTPAAGDILLCEVGATMVGAIIQGYTPDSEVQKGQEKGCFKFGGSTVIMLLEKNTAKVDADIMKNTANGFETCIKFGERIATIIE